MCEKHIIPVNSLIKYYCNCTHLLDVMENFDIYSDLFYDKISSECVFNSVGQCRGDNVFGIICENHASAIFNISIKRFTKVEINRNYRVKYCSLVRPTDFYLQFPYDYREEKFCLNTEKIDTAITKQMQNIDPNIFRTGNNVKVKNIYYIMMSLFSAGNCSKESDTMCKIRSFLSNTKINKYLNTRYTNEYVLVNQSLVQMTKLPVFYKIMLFYIMPCMYYKDNTNIKTRPPNIYLNTDFNNFEIASLPQAMDNVTFYVDENSYFQPLVLFSFTESSSFYDILDMPVIFPKYESIVEDRVTVELCNGRP